MFSVLRARLALRKNFEATLTPLPRAAGFTLSMAFDYCLRLSVLQLLPDSGARLWTFSALRGAEAPDRAVCLRSDNAFSFNDPPPRRAP